MTDMVEESKYKSEYLDDLYVNKHNLEKEWNENSRVSMKWAEKSAVAQYELKMAEQLYKIIKAEVDLEVRENPKDFGWNESKSPTESFIISCVRSSDRYKEASENWAEAIKNAHILKAAENAMSFQRRATCEGLTKLWIFLYNNEKRVPSDVRTALENAEFGREMNEWDNKVAKA